MDYKTSPYISEQLTSGISEEDIIKKNSFNQKFCTIKKYLHWFDDNYKDVKLKDLTSDIVNQFFSYILVKSKMSLNTLKKEQSHFKIILKYAESKNLCSTISNNLIKYKASSKKKEILTQEETKKLFSSIDNFSSLKFYCLHRLAVETACRVGELQGLKIGDIKKIKNKDGANEYWLTINKAWNNKDNIMSKTKTKNSKLVMISKSLYESIKNLNNKNPYKNENGFIFYSSKFKNRPISHQTICDDFKKTFKKMGFLKEGLTFHSYRHLAVVILNDRDYSNKQIMLLTGHKSSQMVEHYANHVTESQKERRREINEEISNFLQKGLDKN